MKRALLVGGAIALVGLLAGEGARSTPVYAVRSGNSCRTCHIEPGGWEDPTFFERDCTLSCKSCHVAPNGGGLRTPAGRFYGMEVLPTWGLRPSDHGDAARHRPAGHPEEGRYRLWEGFSGWWPGDVPAKQVSDRYGFFDPSPLVDVGVDLRGMAYRPIGDTARRLQVFPMQADVYAALFPDEHFALVSSFGLRGRRDGGVDGAGLGKGVVRPSLIDYVTASELYVMADDLPFGAYIRAGRFPVIFGWAFADHTMFSRRNLGFDEDRSVFGLEAGVVQNYAYAHLQVFRQGFPGWFAETLAPADGAALSLGWRDLGWQLGVSTELLSRRLVDDDGDRLNNGGSWTSAATLGLNLYPLVYLSELDWRLSARPGQEQVTAALAAIHEVNWLLWQGVNGKVRYEWLDPDLDIRDDQFHRASVALQWYPVSFTHLEVAYRYAWHAYDVVDSASHDAFLMLHIWY